VARAAEWHHQGQVALIIAGIAVLVAAGGVVFAVALRRGRLRDWRPGNAPPPPAAHTVEEPEAVFFALPDRDPS
jgi:hypothetical protein